VFGSVITRFQERLADCRTFEERISVANQFLIRRTLAASRRDGIRQRPPRFSAGPAARASPPWPDAPALGLRQFERRFVQQAGVSPKLFARIARFEAALDGMARSPQGSWTEIAHLFGPRPPAN
jgi:hypothetical protein